MKKSPKFKQPNAENHSTLRSSDGNRLVPQQGSRKRKKPANDGGKTSKGPNSRPSKSTPLKRKLLVWTAKWSFIGAIWVGIAAVLAFIYFSMTLPDISQLTIVEKKPGITIQTETGTVLAKYGDLYGEYAEYDDLPPHLVNAVIAIEDQRFFDHFGIDVLGLIRAFYVNYREGRVVQGGSTITQQLAKISFLTPERTFTRKLKEVVLALWLEEKLTKKEILSVYLNKVYLGKGNYGVSAASHYYFGKRVQDININEAAILAGLLKAPSKYSPANNPELAKKRANLVLANMVNEGYLTEGQLEQEQRFRPAAIDRGVMETLDNPYFADWILQQLPEYIGNITSDLTITTTLDIGMQRAAEKSVAAILKSDDNQGALVAMSPDGKVLAMVGGKDYYQSQFNRAVKAKRQPGSTFKMFVYLSAFEHGYSPFDHMVDGPIQVKNWSPQNYGGGYKGDVTLMDAFVHSINTVAVKLSEKIGRDNVIALAQRLGIHSNMESIPSIALGSSEVSLLELTTAYAHLASNGLSVKPYSIVQVKDRDGNVLYQRAPESRQRVVSESAVADMNNLMVNVINGGTGKSAYIGRSAGGKTGTSQDFRDAWFIGYTPNLVAGVWVGNDDNSPMKGVTGGKYPAQIWKGFMTQALVNKPALTLPTTNRRFFNNQNKVIPSETMDGINNFFQDLWGSVFGGGNQQQQQQRAPVEYHYPSSR